MNAARSGADSGTSIAARPEGTRGAKYGAKIGAAWWIPGPHFQTTWGRFGRSRRLITLEREILPTPDGDEVVLDHLPGKEGTPRVLLLHGLEGSSYAVYMLGLLRQVARAGWRATAINFRSCARDPSRVRRCLPTRRPRLYHSGETTDLDLVARTMAAREPRTPLYAIGVSLGGNVLLKWLGETGARNPLEGAATISVPFELATAARHLERGLSRLYVNHFLKTLKLKVRDIMARFPAETAHLDARRIAAARTFRAFDDAATAPLHGFSGADDYYLRASSLRYLPRIEVPTLCVNSADDPFLPADVLRRAQEAASDDVRFTVTQQGGHAAFIAGWLPWRPRYWAEERAMAWLAGRPT